MDTQFNVGDLVELTGGSPKMTVACIGNDALAGEVLVTWADGGNEYRALFEPGALRKAEG